MVLRLFTALSYSVQRTRSRNHDLELPKFRNCSIWETLCKRLGLRYFVIRLKKVIVYVIGLIDNFSDKKTSRPH